MKVHIPDETRNILSVLLVKLDDRILEKAISITKANEENVKVIEPYIIDQIVQKLVDYLRTMEV